MVANSPLQQQGFKTPVRNVNTSYSGKNDQRRDGGSGRIIRTILTSSGARPFPSSSGGTEQVPQFSLVDNEKRSYRGTNVQLPPKNANGLEDKHSGANEYGQSSDKFEKRTRNRDRPDCGVWAPLQRSDGSHASSESLSSVSQTAHSALDSSEDAHARNEVDLLVTRGGIRNIGGGSGTSSYSSYNNGTQKQFGRRYHVVGRMTRGINTRVRGSHLKEDFQATAPMKSGSGFRSRDLGHNVPSFNTLENLCQSVSGTLRNLCVCCRIYQVIQVCLRSSGRPGNGRGDTICASIS